MFPGYPGDPSVFQVERARDRRDDVFRMVRDKHHLHAAAGQRVEQEAEALTAFRIKAGKRFVKQQEIGFAGKGAGQEQTPQFSGGTGANALGRKPACADKLQKRRGPVVSRYRPMVLSMPETTSSSPVTL